MDAAAARELDRHRDIFVSGVWRGPAPVPTQEPAGAAQLQAARCLPEALAQRMHLQNTEPCLQATTGHYCSAGGRACETGTGRSPSTFLRALLTSHASCVLRLQCSSEQRRQLRRLLPAPTALSRQRAPQAAGSQAADSSLQQAQSRCLVTVRLGHQAAGSTAAHSSRQQAQMGWLPRAQLVQQQRLRRLLLSLERLTTQSQAPSATAQTSPLSCTAHQVQALCCTLLCGVPLVSTAGSAGVPTLELKVQASINRRLRDYQREGVQFLFQQYSRGRGGLLGDDMVCPQRCACLAVRLQLASLQLKAQHYYGQPGPALLMLSNGTCRGWARPFRRLPSWLPCWARLATSCTTAVHPAALQELALSGTSILVCCHATGASGKACGARGGSAALAEAVHLISSVMGCTSMCRRCTLSGPAVVKTKGQAESEPVSRRVPILVVCTLSLLDNWNQEFMCAPSLAQCLSAVSCCSDLSSSCASALASLSGLTA